MPENIITRAPEIVAALREEAERQPNISLYHNAADLIEQLAAEVERLQDPCGYIALMHKELADYRVLGPIDHLRELVEAEREGRLTVHPAPAKEGDPPPSCFDGEGASLWCRNYVYEDGGEPIERCKRCWYCECGDYADGCAEAEAELGGGGE